jgi:hypothetical protein
MLGILANDTDNAVSLDNLAFVTDRFNACPDFHSLHSPKNRAKTQKLNYANAGFRAAKRLKSGFCRRVYRFLPRRRPFLVNPS